MFYFLKQMVCYVACLYTNICWFVLLCKYFAKLSIYRKIFYYVKLFKDLDVVKNVRGIRENVLLSKGVPTICMSSHIPLIIGTDND